jgi:tRNA (mo5U34)-methyltransferase
MPRYERRDITLNIPVPSAALRQLRRLRGRPVEVQRPGRLLNGGVPELHVTKHVPAESLTYFNARQEHKTSVGHALGDAIEGRTRVDSVLQRQVDSMSWYHTLHLPGGVVTPGIFDHAELLPHYRLPADLSRLRVLDVATFDGYWAFEMERRGATVDALDISLLSQTDLPPAVRAEMLASGSDQILGGGFAIAKEALSSSVNRIACNIYDLSPETAGQYDFVHLADLLLHLERPLEALRRVRSVCTGRALITDAFLPYAGRGPRRVIEYMGGWFSATWWLPSLDALAQMVLDAGFADVEVLGTYNLATADEYDGVWRGMLSATV